MKKINVLLAAVTAVSIMGMMFTNSAAAAIETEYYAPEYWGMSGPNWVIYPLGCSDNDVVEFVIRAGDLLNGAGSSEPELLYLIDDEPEGDNGSFAIFNGVDFDFTLTHDAASGDFTWSRDGGPSITWHSGRPGEAVRNIFFMAKSSNNSPYTATVYNVVLNSQAILETLVSTDGQKPSMRIFGEPFADFILQGTGNFAWTGGIPPQGTKLQIRIAVVFETDDIDSDGFGNDCDNCPNIWSTDLTDTDNDGVGNICDFCPGDPTNDEDNDGICGLSDNCQAVANADQADCDTDTLGDVCDPDSPCSTDTDGDGVMDSVDNCIDAANPSQTDADTDGAGDACDPCPNDAANDADGDGVCGDVDNCPAIANALQADCDTDTLGDVCDPDSPCSTDTDGDGVMDSVDNCPADANALQADCDTDTLGDVCDPDSPCSTDTDGDGVMDSVDNCPAVANADQTDADGDGVGDVCDLCLGDDTTGDSDGDGVCDDIDVCLGDDATGDADGDGVCDDTDNCPADANALQADCDTDGLGDVCDPDSSCSTDTDGDGVMDSVDNCIDDANPTQADQDTDGIGDACDDDIDGDTVLNIDDNCPAASNTSQADCDGNNIGDACDAVNPGAVEICDTIDNNCDGNVDEGVLITFYQDADGDTYGCPFSPTEEACEASPGYVDDITDCNENEYSANIAGLEVCDDLIDNNCDGVVDEGCSWKPVQMIEGSLMNLYGYTQAAYENMTPSGNGNINMQAEIFSESLFMNHPDIRTVNLAGGFDADFNPMLGEFSTILSSCGPALTVGGGTTVFIENIILK